MKKVLKIVLRVVLILIALVVLVTGFFAIKGAVLWSNSKKELSVTQAAQDILADEDFIKYDELPQFYL